MIAQESTSKLIIVVDSYASLHHSYGSDFAVLSREPYGTGASFLNPCSIGTRRR